MIDSNNNKIGCDERTHLSSIRQELGMETSQK